MRLRSIGSLSLALLFAVGGVACKPAVQTVERPSAKMQTMEGESSIRVLEQRIRYQVDESGTFVREEVNRFEVLDKSAVDVWGRSSAYFSPWYMERPEIDVSVKTPVGETVELDPATISESPVNSGGGDIYSDAVILVAPIPALTVGSVVEERIVTKTTRPYHGDGFLESQILQTMLAKDKVEVEIDLPKDTPFEFRVDGIEPKVVDAVKGDRRVIKLTLEDVPALKLPESYLPWDYTSFPSLTFSTVSSWKALATDYAKIVDTQLEAFAPPQEVIDRIRAAKTREEKASEALAWLRTRVRYTGLELGENALVPVPPSETLARGYGDCKDQATLLVGTLRAAGVDANVAVLSSGSGNDVHPELPGFDHFNHAIAVLPGKEPLFIDPTSTTARVGELPLSDQGRRALIASPSSKELVTIPRDDASHNTYRETRHVYLQPLGAAKVGEQSEATGVLEQQLRYNFGASSSDIKRSLEGYVESAYNQASLANFKVTPAEDLSQSFLLEVEAEGAKMGISQVLLAEAALGFGPLFDYLPLSALAAEERDNPLQLPILHEVEVKWVIHPPEGFVSTQPVTFRRVDLSPLEFERSSKKLEDGSIELTFRLAANKLVLSADEVRGVRKAILALGEEEDPYVSFQPQGLALIEEGKLAEGAAVSREMVDSQPDSPVARLRHANVLLRLGFGEEARAQAKKAEKLDQKSADVAYALADVLERDLFGRFLTRGYDVEGSREALGWAVERSTEDELVANQVQAAVMFEHGTDGTQYSRGSDLRRAIKEFSKIEPDELRAHNNGAYIHNIDFDLFYLEAHDELATHLEKKDPADVMPSLALANAAALGGRVDALSYIDRRGLRGDERRTALEAASGFLARIRRYQAAADLVELAADGQTDGAQLEQRAEMLRGFRKTDPAKVQNGSPEDVLYSAAGAMLANGELRCAEVKGLCSSDLARLGEAVPGTDTSGVVVEEVQRVVAVDSMRSTMKVVDVEGDKTVGFFVHSKNQFTGDAGRFEALVVQEKGSLRLAATSDTAHLVGDRALSFLAKGKKKEAKTLLEWAAVMLPKMTGSDPVQSGSFQRAWDAGKGDPKTSALALSLSGSAKRPKSLAAATKAMNAASGDDKLILGRAIFDYHFEHEEFAKAEKMAQTLRAAGATKDVVDYLEARCLANQGKFKQADAILTKLIADDSRATYYRLTHYLGALVARKPKRVREVVDKAQADNVAVAFLHTGAAIAALELEDVRDRDLEHALLGVQLEENLSALLVLALSYLERGKLADADRTIQRVAELRTGGEAGPVELYTRARFAEALGFKKVAKSMYRSVKLDDPAYDFMEKRARKRAKSL